MRATKVLSDTLDSMHTMRSRSVGFGLRQAHGRVGNDQSCGDLRGGEGESDAGVDGHGQILTPPGTSTPQTAQVWPTAQASLIGRT